MSLSLLFIVLVALPGFAQLANRAGSAPPTLVDWPFLAFSVIEEEPPTTAPESSGRSK